jgi:DNA-binding transcriptional LysR family regulator
MVAPHIIASSDLLLTMPERVARVLAPPLDLVVLEPPPELLLTGFTISMLWHERTHSDPARCWLRDVIALCRECRAAMLFALHRPGRRNHRVALQFGSVVDVDVAGE